MSKHHDEQGHAPLARGAAIGRYVVLNLLGRGGMGEVYAAYDPELDRKVAVKLLRARIENGVTITEGRQRTMREAQAIARLSHPNVIVVFDVGTFLEQVFIAMEFVDGCTASYWSHAQPRTWQEVLKVYAAAGQGLAAAHEKGMVHRDFKPENIMVARNGEVRVMDFGLARQIDGRRTTTPVSPPVTTTTAKFGEMATDGGTIVLHRRDGGASPTATSDNHGVVEETRDTEPSPSAGVDLFGARLTRTGAIMGTPAYMAPEQFFKAATDARSDQFSFCVALYEALYGERPFPGNNIQSLVGNIVQGNIRDPPPGSKVPFWVRKVILRGLRPTPAERYPSMADLLEALRKDPRVRYRRIAAGAMLALLPLGFGFGARQVMAERPPLCTGGADKLDSVWELTPADAPDGPHQAKIHDAFLRTGKTYAADVYETVRHTLTDYAQRWSNAYKETCEATQLRHEQSPEVLDLRMSCLNERLSGLRALAQVFESANGDVVQNAVSASGLLPSLERCSDVALLRAIVKPPEESEIQSKVDDLRQRLADLKARFDAGRWKEALREAPDLIERARAVKYDPLIAEALALDGFMNEKAFQGRSAEAALAEAYWLADSSRHDEVRAEVATQLVYVTGYQNHAFDRAQEWSHRAAAVIQRLGGHDLLRSWLMNNLGCAHFVAGHSDATIAALAEALDLKEKLLGSDHPDVAVSEGNLGYVLGRLGRYAEGLPHTKRAIAINEKRLGLNHPGLANELSNEGELLNGLGRFVEARKAFTRALAIFERELGPDAGLVAGTLMGIGTSYLAESSPAEAVPVLERAVSVSSRNGTDLLGRADSLFALARAFWESGRSQTRARRLATEARDLFAKARMDARLNAVDSWLAGHLAS
ncbi:MAG TPA: tetratricopeptide repeat protein [Polyangia bacterium]|nr:tetratricopeptide repeat protein [Polyangia bacterium]